MKTNNYKTPLDKKFTKLNFLYDYLVEYKIDHFFTLAVWKGPLLYYSIFDSLKNNIQY
jgi:hypothetical protein